MDFFAGIVICAVLIGICIAGYVLFKMVTQKPSGGSITVGWGDNAKPIETEARPMPRPPELRIVPRSYESQTLDAMKRSERQLTYHRGVAYVYDDTMDCWRFADTNFMVTDATTVAQLNDRTGHSVPIPGARSFYHEGVKYYRETGTNRFYYENGSPVMDAFLISVLIGSATSMGGTAFAHTVINPEPRFVPTLWPSTDKDQSAPEPEPEVNVGHFEDEIPSEPNRGSFRSDDSIRYDSFDSDSSGADNNDDSDDGVSIGSFD
jgi:hypothetical protein